LLKKLLKSKITQFQIGFRFRIRFRCFTNIEEAKNKIEHNNDKSESENTSDDSDDEPECINVTPNNHKDLIKLNKALVYKNKD